MYHMASVSLCLKLKQIRLQLLYIFRTEASKQPSIDIQNVHWEDERMRDSQELAAAAVGTLKWPVSTSDLHSPVPWGNGAPAIAAAADLRSRMLQWQRIHHSRREESRHGRDTIYCYHNWLLSFHISPVHFIEQMACRRQGWMFGTAKLSNLRLIL